METERTTTSFSFGRSDCCQVSSNIISLPSRRCVFKASRALHESSMEISRVSASILSIFETTAEFACCVLYFSLLALLICLEYAAQLVLTCPTARLDFWLYCLLMFARVAEPNALFVLLVSFRGAPNCVLLVVMGVFGNCFILEGVSIYRL